MNANEIGKRLRSMRTSMGVSRIEFANAVGVSRNAIANYESGIRIPKDDVKSKIADYYGKDIDSIFFARETHGQ